MDRRPLNPLVLVAAGAPVAFTAAWLTLGLTRPRYSASRDTISALAAEHTWHATWMVVAFVIQGLGQLACARLAWRRDRARWVAAWLVLAGVGTLVAGLVRLPDPRGGGAGHAIGATLAFTGLHLAALAGAGSRQLPRWLRVGAAAALVVAVPHLAWFLAHLGAGGAWYGASERIFVTVLLAWCGALAVHRARPPA